MIAYRPPHGASADVAGSVRDSLSASGLLSMDVPLDYSVTIEKTASARAPCKVVVTYDGSPAEQRIVLIECYLEVDDSGVYEFEVHSFFLDPSCRFYLGTVRSALRGSTPPRTVGGWGMEVVGAVSRFLAADFELPTLRVSLYDTWSVKLGSSDRPVTSRELKRSASRRKEYAELRHARLGVDENVLIRRLKRGGFYGTWGFEPESDEQQQDMHAVVSPGGNFDTLLRTRSCIGRRC